MEESKEFILIRLKTGESVIGSVVKDGKKKSITLNCPMLYQTVTVVDEKTKVAKHILMFKDWNEFSSDETVTFTMDSIMTKSTANEVIITFYMQELQRKIVENSAEIFESKQDPENDSSKLANILGNMSFNFNFENPDHFQMFMDSIQMGIEGLMDEIEGNGDDDFEDEDFPLESLMKNPNPPKKKAKKRKIKKESFELPFEDNGDPNDPRSWSNDPNDYI